MKRSRRQPFIVDIHSDPRDVVCLRVAADYLGLDERTTRARIEEGLLPALRDGRVYEIALADLIAYDANRRKLAS